jgi:hypothetical protein
MISTASESDATQQFSIRRTQASLLAALAVIDGEGWDGAVATALLCFVRDDLVRPMVLDIGLRGAAATQAEATGWATAWEVLTDPTLRAARSPWGIVWTAVRRAVRAEQVSAAYGVPPRKAWRLARPSHANLRFRPPVSLAELVELGWEPADPPGRQGMGLGPVLTCTVQAMTEVGWDETDAQRLVRAIAETITRADVLSSQLTGWRRVLQEVNLPAWRVRRVTVLLVGVPGWPGLVERIQTEGPDVLRTPPVRAALRSTVHASHRSPVLAARRRVTAA